MPLASVRVVTPSTTRTCSHLFHPSHHHHHHHPCSPVVYNISIRNFNDTTFSAQEERVLITIYGKNFGLTRFSRSVFVQLMPHGNSSTSSPSLPLLCTYFTSFGDSTLGCEFVSTQRVESRVVVVNVLGKTSSANSSAAVIQSKCFAPFFGRAGEICMPCPPGATCPGGDNPLSRSGFWRQGRQQFLR
jgi:hypothetical protein